MKIKGLFYLIFSFLIASVTYSEKGIKNLASIKRSTFPKDFVFGTASSAYQYEGAAFVGGKGPSIWDTFTEKFPEKIKDRSNGTIADDSYHKYKEDVAIMKDIGFNVYRFSISWPRLLPRGHLSGGVNQEGIDYYNNLINELLSKGIQPFATLFHWDVPQALEDEYSGFLSAKIANDFRDYADLCYSKFGDRVKHWITLNEPLTFAAAGYTSGSFAPGRCSHWVSPNCVAGDSSTEPYLVGHNQLLAHAAAVKVYRDKYQASQKGQIGITLNSAWFIPFNESNDQDSAAAARALAFQYDWFMEPLKSGSYPGYMVSHVGQRLPQFSQEQTFTVKGSYDFIGVNYYTSNYATDIPCKTQDFSYGFDSCVKTSAQRNGVFIGAKSGSSWLYVYPKGIQELLLYTKNKFNDPVIYITENGVSELDTGSVSLEDDLRVNYINDHLASIQNAMASGVKVKGYFVWSLLDNFEWTAGYTVRFGVVYVDYKDGLKRYPKKSAKWFKEFLLSAGNQNQKQEDISHKDL